MRLLRYAFLTLVLALAGALTVPSAHAQIIPSFGATGGLNFGSLSDAAGVDLENSTGYHIGIYAEAGFGSISVRPSLLYLRLGELEFDDALNPFDLLNADVSFIAIPVDLKYSFPSPLVKPYVLAGPEVRFPLGDLADLENVESVNFAGNVGLGAKLGAFIGPEVFAELRYAFDLSGTFGEIPGTDIETDGSVNAFFIRVGLGL
jgi:hypothetical protein